MSRLISVALGCTVVLAVALPAPAQGFSGPWDSAHEPQEITNPGVTVNDGWEREGATAFEGFGKEGTLEISLDQSLTCPSGLPQPYSVTFADPTGSLTVPLEDPCRSTWQEAIARSLRTTA